MSKPKIILRKRNKWFLVIYEVLVHTETTTIRFGS